MPTLVTYNILLMGASAERKWEQVADTFKELLSVGLVPDAITLDCLCGIEKLQVAADARNHRNLHCRRPMGAIFEETIDASLDSTHIQVNHVGSVVDISSSESDKQLPGKIFGVCLEKRSSTFRFSIYFRQPGAVGDA